MYYLKNKLLLLLIILFSIVLVGCEKKEYTTNVITEENIIKQEEKEYYVYFYKDNCKYCEDVFDIVNEYLNNPTELKLYVCKIGPDSVINKAAEKGQGQGPNGKYYVDHVIDYEELYIAGAPSLIKVRFNGAIYECFFVTSGRKNIIQYFTDLNNKEEK